MISPPTGPLLFDTGIYIRFSRGENCLWQDDDARVFQRRETPLFEKPCRLQRWKLFSDGLIVNHFFSDGYEIAILRPCPVYYGWR